jgi:hypothetical protein
MFIFLNVGFEILGKPISEAVSVHGMFAVGAVVVKLLSAHEPTNMSGSSNPIP